MGQSGFEGPRGTKRKAGSCRGCAPEPEVSEDAELRRLFHELALTALKLVDQDEADILERFELRGQSVSEIAHEIGCSRVEAARRLDHAQRCFCQFVILTLARAQPE